MSKEIKMKILFVIHSLSIGGVQKSLISLLNVVDYDKYDITVLVLTNEQTLCSDIGKQIKVIINDDRQRYFAKPKNFLKLCGVRAAALLGNKEKAEMQNRMLSDSVRQQRFRFIVDNNDLESNYDCAVAYMQGYPAEFVARYIHANRKIVFYHGSEDEHHDLHEKIFPVVDAIVGCSSLVAQELKKYYPRMSDKILWLDNYIDAEIVRKAAMEYDVEKKNVFTICTCTRVAKDKSCDRIVEAARLLKEQGIPFLWYIIGDGIGRSAVEEMIMQYDLRENVVITGFKSNPFPYFRVSDVFTLCTDDEGLPMAMLEAQALSLPIVSTKTAGGLYLVEDGENGLLTDFSAESVADALARLSTNPEIVAYFRESLNTINLDKKRREYTEKLDELLTGKKTL